MVVVIIVIFIIMEFMGCFAIVLLIHWNSSRLGIYIRNISQFLSIKKESENK